MKAEISYSTNTVVGFHFTDTLEFVCAHFRRGVAYSRHFCERRPDINVSWWCGNWLAGIGKMIDVWNRSLIFSLTLGYNNRQDVASHLNSTVTPNNCRDNGPTSSEWEQFNWLLEV